MQTEHINLDFVAKLYRDAVQRSVKEYLGADVVDSIILTRNRNLQYLSKGTFKVLEKRPLQIISDSEESRIIHCLTNNNIPFISYYDVERAIVIKKQDYKKFCMYLRSLVENNKKENVAFKPIMAKETEKIIQEEIFDFFKNGELAQKCGIKVTKGIIISSDPGLGKTSILKWVRSIAESKKLSYDFVTEAKIAEYFGKNKLAELFHGANIVCFDDIDISMLASRNGSNGKNVCAMLSAMDGPSITAKTPILRIFTTNESLKSIDEAFMRPGRIDKLVNIGMPDAGLRRRFLDSWHEYITSKLTEGDKRTIVDGTHKYSFAWMESVKSELFKQLVNTNTINIDKALRDGSKVELNTVKKVGFANG